MGKKQSETTGPRKVKVLFFFAFHHKKNSLIHYQLYITGYLWHFDNIYQVYWWSDSWTRMYFTAAIDTISKKWVKTNTIVERKIMEQSMISLMHSCGTYWGEILRTWKSSRSFHHEFPCKFSLWCSDICLKQNWSFYITDICYSVLYLVTRRVQVIKRRKWKW